MCVAPTRERIEATGAEFVAFRRTVPAMDITQRETDSLRDWEAGTRFGSAQRILKNGLFAFVVNASRDCAELLGRWPADAVVLDWMVTGAAIAAEAARVPAFALVHCPYPLPVPGATSAPRSSLTRASGAHRGRRRTPIRWC
jgi:hypothetical protein